MNYALMITQMEECFLLKIIDPLYAAKCAFCWHAENMHMHAIIICMHACMHAYKHKSKIC